MRSSTVVCRVGSCRLRKVAVVVVAVVGGSE